MTDEKTEPKQITLAEALRSDVNPIYVSERAGLSYVTGRYVKEALNQFFGPLGWGYEVIDQYRDSTDERSARWFVHVRLSVTVDGNTTTRDGLAVGHGLLEGRKGPVSPGRANEVWDFAAAEAVTDAIKRAAVSLGGAFGLNLYPLVAGEKKNTSQASRPAPKKKTPKKDVRF